MAVSNPTPQDASSSGWGWFTGGIILGGVVATGGVLVALKLSNGRHSMLGEAGDATVFPGKRIQPAKRAGSRSHMTTRYEYDWVTLVFDEHVRCLLFSQVLTRVAGRHLLRQDS